MQNMLRMTKICIYKLHLRFHKKNMDIKLHLVIGYTTNLDSPVSIVEVHKFGMIKLLS